MIKKILLATMIAGSFGAGVAVTAPAMAAVVVVREAPPPPRDEVAPPARRGYAWQNGHWEWRNNHYVWTKGMWVRERRGYRYNQPTWAERDGKWVMTRGAWARGNADNDGDGVRNRDDARPNNPNRN
jgi:hypothetical protein